MSFGEDVRHELVERPPAKACCRPAFMSGLIRTAGTLQVRSGGELAVRIELIDATAARTLFTLLRPAEAGIEIVSYREPRFARRNVVSVRLHGARSLQLLHELGVLAEALTPLTEPPRRLVNRRCCRGAYLRGAFVATGSVSAPRRPATSSGAPPISTARRRSREMAAPRRAGRCARSSGAATPSPTPRARPRSATCWCRWAPTTRRCRSRRRR